MKGKKNYFMDQPGAVNENKIIVTKFFIYLKFILYFKDRPSAFNKNFLYVC